MEARPTYYCWSCYAVNLESCGPCQACGQPVDGPPGLDYVDRLIWSLHHPLPERRIIATEVLGARSERRALAPLRRLLDEGVDPYLAIAVLQALVRITGVADNQDLLHRYANYGPAPARRAAHHLLTRLSREQPPPTRQAGDNPGSQGRR